MRNEVHLKTIWYGLCENAWFQWQPLIVNIHEYANYANMITFIFDHGMNDLCLSCHSVQIVVIHG